MAKVGTLVRVAAAAEALMIAAAAPRAGAEVVRLEVKSVQPAFEGRSFGEVGPYQQITALAHYRVDPRLPVNAGLVNIHKAPKQADGRIALDADVVILKPLDLRKANGRMVYEMVNRGRALALGTFNGGSPGDGFLLSRGYTLVMSGWQAAYPLADAPGIKVALASRLPLRPGDTTTLTARLPIAVNRDGTPVTGVTREQFFDVGPGPTFVGYLTYPAADPAEKAIVTVRETSSGPSSSPPALTYRYLDPWRVEITKPPGTTAGALYEFVYRAKDPVVYGLGLASMRDLVSFLRYDGTSANPLLLGGAPAIKAVLGFGASQTGRTLKELVYEFNEDEKGRKLFDGVMIQISGAGRNALNSAFSRPGLKDAQHTSWGLRGDDFPFSYPVIFDRLSRRTDGVLARCQAVGNCPKLMHLDSEQELWQGGALTFVDADGRDLHMPDNVRVYTFAGGEHSADPRGPNMSVCSVAEPSTIAWRPFARALFLALDDWTTRGRAPPPSRYPAVAAGELVPVAAYRFPQLPQVGYPAPLAEKYLLDFSQEPPERLARYPALVPKPDADGAMLGGVRHPFMVAPLATNVGWNPRKAGMGAGGGCYASGMSIPFSRTRAEREASGDPRRSVEERYRGEADFVAQVGGAADRLVRERLLLPNDAEAIKAEAPLRYRRTLAAPSAAVAAH
jgi:hypothetical protein